MTKIVIHADDVGMCHGTNVAFEELRALNTITSGSVMVPCPWFSEIAEMGAADPALDVGVHLTLNAEQQHYRWRPISAAGPSSGLVDLDGFLWGTVAETRANAHPVAVEEEWRAQIDRALAAGIDVTHLDAHMGAALAPEWCERYIRVGIDYGVPVLITRTFDGYGPNNHLGGTTNEQFAEFVAEARAAGMPIFDVVLETDFARVRGVAPDYEGMLVDLAEHDLVYCAYHPCAPGPGEVEVIEPDQHHVRTDEYALFRTDEWGRWLDAQPFERVTMRELATS
ncbi:MAG: ChbG/HpnK family deacetylase [Acidimicrobiales bacterium]